MGRACAETSYHYLLDSVKIFGGDLAPMGGKKPHPDLYQMAMLDLGVREKSDCCVIEDTNEGMRAALSAGLSHVIVTKSLFSSQDDFTERLWCLTIWIREVFLLKTFFGNKPASMLRLLQTKNCNAMLLL